MRSVLAFDVYGTLIDTSGVVHQLATIVGERAGEFARVWRDKQLEYSFRRGLMHSYVDFSLCIEQSLQYTSESLGAKISGDDRAMLLDKYRELPCFDDVVDALAALSASGLELYAFSNGARSTVEHLLDAQGIHDYFVDIVSVEEVGTFKPNPAVYLHFLQRAGVDGDRAWLISGNPFDVIGAIGAGMKGVWVRRSAAQLFDPWGIEPDLIVSSLAELDAQRATLMTEGSI